MPPGPEHQQLIDRILSSAETLRRAVAAVPAARQAAPPSPGEWSALETLVHVRNVVVMAYGLRIRRLFYETDPVFADYDEAAHRRASLARGERASDLLDTVVAEQQQLARLLATLPDDAWGRQGHHAELGAMSISFLARRVAEHAEEHAAQIAAAAAPG
jgi:DinB superfamily